MMKPNWSDKIIPAVLLGLVLLLQPGTVSALDRTDCMKDPRWCDGLIRDNPNDVDLLLLRAAGYESQKNWEKALADYAAAVVLDPNDPDLFIRKAKVEKAAGKGFSAVLSYLEAARLDPGNVEYALLSAQSTCTEPDFDVILRKNPRNADGFLMAAICSQRSGNPNLARAEKLENRAIALKPDFGAAYYNRSLLYVAKHDYRRALADLDSLERIDSDNADVYTLRGVILGAQGDVGAAIREHGKAIVADPLGAKRYLFRAMALLNAGQLSSALVDANRAVMLDPRDGASYQTRGKIRETMGDKTSSDLDYQMASLSPETRAELAKPFNGKVTSPKDEDRQRLVTTGLVVFGVLGLAFFMFRGRKTAIPPPSPPAPPAAA